MIFSRHSGTKLGEAICSARGSFGESAAQAASPSGRPAIRHSSFKSVRSSSSPPSLRLGPSGAAAAAAEGLPTSSFFNACVRASLSNKQTNVTCTTKSSPSPPRPSHEAVDLPLVLPEEEDEEKSLRMRLLPPSGKGKRSSSSSLGLEIAREAILHRF